MRRRADDQPLGIFASDDDVNTRVLGWLDTVANVRVHGTLMKRPADWFEAERKRLLPLAPSPT